MKVTIEIVCDNAAFGECPGSEVARILRELAAKVDSELVVERLDGASLRDFNGNKVGSVAIT